MWLDNIKTESLDYFQELNASRRYDFKYLITLDKAQELLKQLSANYYFLQIDGTICHNYHTLYYDTPLLTTYYLHYNGRLPRFKIRSRKYKRSNETYLEIKYKTNHEVCIKIRKKRNLFLESLSPEEKLFIQEHLSFSDLLPILYVSFERITIGNALYKERTTFDFNLSYKLIEGNSLKINNLVVMEVKFQEYNYGSLFFTQVWRNRLHPEPFSKYCIGLALLSPHVKKNNFLETIRKINKNFQINEI